jgi:lysophospholipid acyltransferase (LPLAT)-like uncharacterized protein
MRLNNRLVLATAPYLVSLIVKLLGWTIRFSTIGSEEVERRWQQGLPSIYALWHQRLLMMPLAYKGAGLYVLISNHRDGELIARAVSLAKATGLPIFPATYACSRRKEFNSWDRFIVPAPFSRGAFVFGDPIGVPDDADEQTVEALRQTLETRLIEITERAEQLVRGDTP